jgi:hypothetical protein
LTTQRRIFDPEQQISSPVPLASKLSVSLVIALSFFEGKYHQINISLAGNDDRGAEILVWNRYFRYFSFPLIFWLSVAM